MFSLLPVKGLPGLEYKVPGAKLNPGLCTGRKGTEQLHQVSQKAAPWILERGLHVNNGWHSKQCFSIPAGGQEETGKEVWAPGVHFQAAVWEGSSQTPAGHEGSLRARPPTRAQIALHHGTANSISQPDKTNCEIYLSQAGLSST